MMLWRFRKISGVGPVLGIGAAFAVMAAAVAAEAQTEQSEPLSPALTEEIVAAAATPEQTPEDAAFAAWVDGMRAEALESGISPDVIEAGLGEVKRVVRAISKDRNQPEFNQTYETYLRQRVSQWRIEKGSEMLAENAELFEAVAEKYGIQPRFVAAIWGIETNYGTIELSYPAFDVLATLGHEGRREAYFRGQIIDGLKILQQGDATLDVMKSSWAGALGQPQFMPGIYLEYAQDFDNDGDKDIWTSRPDVVASIARHLTAIEWHQDETWGRPVIVPDVGDLRGPAGQGDAAGALETSKGCKRFSKSLGPWRPISEWQALGIRRLNDGDLPMREIPAALIPPEKGGSKGYLVYRNFCTIMWYNPAFKYALGVGLLGDRIKK